MDSIGESMDIRKGGSTNVRARSRKTKTETVSVRLDPKLRFMAELAARRQRRTLSSFVEWAIEDSLYRVLITQEIDSRGNYKGKSISEVAATLWDVSEADRFARLAFRYPDLLNHHEQICWKLIRENGYLWKGRHGEVGDRTEANLIWARLRETWDLFNAVACGDKPQAQLPKSTVTSIGNEGDETENADDSSLPPAPPIDDDNNLT
jgi:hypothetical protein